MNNLNIFNIRSLNTLCVFLDTQNTWQIKLFALVCLRKYCKDRWQNKMHMATKTVAFI